MDIKDILGDLDIDDMAKSMGFSGACGGPENGPITSTVPASAVVDKCFDSLKERPTLYRRLFPSIVTGPGRSISLATSEERKEREDMWTYVPAKLTCADKLSFDDIGEPLWVGFNPTAYDGFGFWEIHPEEPVEVPRWVVEFVNKKCVKYVWKSVTKSEEALAREQGRGAGAVQKCAIGYTNMLVRNNTKNTHTMSAV